MINSKYVHSSLAPWCLRAGVEKYCSDTVRAVVLEGTVNEKSDDVLNRLLSENADVVGFCCYIWNITFVKKLAENLKKSKPDTVIIFGGPEVSYNSEEILSGCIFVDYVLSGEGEYTYAALCSAINNNTDVCKVDGLSYRKDGKIIVGRPYSSKEEPVSPYCDEYVSNLKGRIAYIEASRGCPYSCAFCLSGRCSGMIFYDVERVKKEILMLANSSAKTVKFVDRTFNANSDRANEIIKFILDNYGSEIPDDVCFHFEIEGDILKESTMALLKKLPDGAVQLEIGLQSFNEKTLNAVNRHTDLGKLSENIKKLVSFGNMHIHIDLIAGLPLEDINSFKNSFNRAYALKTNMLQLGFLKLLYGSVMRSEMYPYPCEYSDSAPYEVISTKWLKREEMEKIHCAEDALDRLYNSGRFIRTLDYLIDECGYEPFELFMSAGEGIKNTEKTALDDYVKKVYDFFRVKSFIDEEKLRDVMICDRLSTNSSGVLPECLKAPDARLKRLKKYIKENLKKSGRTACAILYSKNCAVCCDYTERNAVTGAYKLEYIFGE